jgi:tetratricopeptide (TPR) repeat protein
VPRLLLLALLACAGGCRRSSPRPPEEARAALRAPSAEPATKPAPPPPRPLVRCFPGDTGVTPPRALGELLDRAADRFDAADFSASLACADEAARTDPRSVEAHHDRAVALQELERLDDARDAFTRALALDPDDPETLAGAADLYINRLAATPDHTETGLEMARRGSHRVKRSRARAAPGPRAPLSPADRSLASRLALLEGQALNDLGRPREALARLEAALAIAAPASSDELRVRYERASALFELCRFSDAKRGFLDVIARSPDDAWAHHHLGLVLERLGDDDGAREELSRARALAPSEFKPPVLLDPTAFRALVDAEAQRLPAPLVADLAHVDLETADLPDVEDLIAEEPPLSPTILGLFRGAPLGDPVAPPASPRTIVVYRKNLARAVATHAELLEQVRTTLLHELGHLRGEDDEALRARGLE